MKHKYTPKGVCSKKICFETDGDLVRNISFESGCSGNLQGLAKLADNRPAAEVISLLSGIKCGKKKTSCPDQLAESLKKCLEKKRRADKED